MSDLSPDRPEAERLSPLPVRVIVWLVLILIAVLAIRVIDAHLMTIQRRGGIQMPDTRRRMPGAGYQIPDDGCTVQGRFAAGDRWSQESC